jgi:hypothetical protein
MFGIAGAEKAGGPPGLRFVRSSLQNIDCRARARGRGTGQEARRTATFRPIVCEFTRFSLLCAPFSRPLPRRAAACTQRSRASERRDKE